MDLHTIVLRPNQKSNTREGDSSRFFPQRGAVISVEILGGME